MKIFARVLLVSALFTGFAVQIGAQPGPKPGTPPNAPTNLTATPGQWNNFPYVNLQWQGQLKGTFNIYRKVGAISDTGSYIKLYKHLFTNNWEDQNVQSGNTYSYYVTAQNPSGESAGSDTVSVTLGSPAAKAVITGILKDKSGNPILKGQIVFIPVLGWDLVDIPVDTLTGTFKTHLAPGSYIIYSAAPGYIPEYYNDVSWIMNATQVAVKSGDSLNFNITLAQKVIPQKYTLSGNVSDSSGNPLKAAHISVYNVALNSWSRLFYQAVTDSSGNYSVQVKQGDTLVVVAHTSDKEYFPQFYNDQTTFQTANKIAVTQNITGINFVLLHKPVYNNGISGVVINSDSVGIPALIQAILLGDNNVKHRYTTITDSLGNYSFVHMIPGDYILLAIPQNGYIPTFFTDSTQTLKWKDADSIVVTASSIVTGINFMVTALPDSGAATVNGRITDNTGNPLNGAFVYAVDGNQQTFSFGISDSAGNYTIGGLIPGSYSVTSQLYGYDNTQTSSVSLGYSTSSSVSSSASFALTPESVTAVKENTPAVIGSYKLNQNYPNPFNPSTVISFTIPNQSKVELKVYNILGKEVATLVNESKPAGSYNVTFNAGKLSSGVYFYQLQAGNFISTKKLMLLK
jgi:protocatechuate 3,4-dioxygenase beta subunit